MEAHAKEQADGRDRRMAWWREAKFGLFIHWGVYAVPAGIYKGEKIDGIGEWIMRRAEIPVDEYRAYAKQFNPVKYDPDEWARLAKEAGMKYIVITSKHHDGFALYDSEVTDWDVVDATPYGKDLLAPLAEAARRHGLKFGLYYSQAQDWVHPGGAKSGMPDFEGWDEAHKGSFDRYLEEIALPQVREILTKYNPDVLWWDTPHLMTPERAEKLQRAVDEISPDIIANNRLLRGSPGDFSTPEQYIPPTGLNYDWETCMTMNGTWGFKSYDHDWKSVETLIRNLVDIASKGGNYLLNVGPTAEGEIPAASIERLREIGEWMRKNGDSLYGTTASPVRRPEWGRVTTKAGDGATTLYLHVFDWPADGKLELPVRNQVAGAHLLSDEGRTFDVQTGESGAVVQLTGTAPDPIDSVVVVTLRGRPEVLPYFAPQAQDGTVGLSPEDADLVGDDIRIESNRRQLNIDGWSTAGDYAQWRFTIDRPGGFDVVVELAGSEASGFAVEVRAVEASGTAGVARLDCEVSGADDGDEFREVSLGQIKLERPGRFQLALKPLEGKWRPVKVRSVALRPA